MKQAPIFNSATMNTELVKSLYAHVDELTKAVQVLEAALINTIPQPAGSPLALGVAASPASAGTLRQVTPSEPVGAEPGVGAAQPIHYPEPRHVASNRSSKRAWQRHCATLGRPVVAEEVQAKLKSLPPRSLYTTADMVEFWGCSIEEAQAWAFFGNTFCFWKYNDKDRSRRGYEPRPGMQ